MKSTLIAICTVILILIYFAPFTIAADTDSIVVDTSGNVGIGTCNPTGKFEVLGDIRAGNSDIYFTKTDHNHTGIGNTQGYAAIENAANFDSLMILGRSGTSKGRYVGLWDYLQVNGSMDITGRIGIGTSSPMKNLHLLSPSGSNELIMEVADGAENFRKWNFVVDGGQGNPQNFCIRRLNDVGNGGLVEFVITGSGNVGIGTSGPKAKFSLSYGNGDMVNIYSPADNTLAIQTTIDNQPIGTYGGDGENRLVLQPAVGSVGIGTSSPNAKLHVVQEGDYTWNEWERNPLELWDNNEAMYMGADDDHDISYIQAVGNYATHSLVLNARGGNVGIGTAVPQDRLDVNGYVRANGSRLTSDARLKENIESLENALDIVTQMRGVSYNWIDPSRGEGHQIGVIAQEVEQVLPEVVHTDNQGYKSVEYAKLVAPLIEAV